MTVVSLQRGRFASQDPLGYIDGANRYQAYGGGPGNHVDPLGLSYGDIAGFAPALGDFGRALREPGRPC